MRGLMGSLVQNGPMRNGKEVVLLLRDPSAVIS